MKTILNTLAVLAVVGAVGCSEGTTRKDVASARDKLDKEKQQTAETVREAQRDVADAQNTKEHTAAKPVTPDQTPADQQRIADANVDAAQKILKQKQEERAAAANVADKQQQLQTTQARDAYVREVETKLADIDKQIDSLKQRASNAQGAD
jgi:hypothetical protein